MLRIVLLTALLATPALAAPVGLCHGRQASCVVDGDTLRWAREDIRLVGIDTPEMHHPRCVVQSPLGPAAAQRLVQLMAGSSVVIERHGRDRYKRTLARVIVDEVDVGAQLLAEGFARVYVPGEKPWCG